MNFQYLSEDRYSKPWSRTANASSTYRNNWFSSGRKLEKGKRRGKRKEKKRGGGLKPFAVQVGKTLENCHKASNQNWLFQNPFPLFINWQCDEIVIHYVSLYPYYIIALIFAFQCQYRNIIWFYFRLKNIDERLK